MTRIARLSISNIDFLRKSSMVAVWFLATALFTLAFLCQPPAQAQTTSATLTATVFDASGAVVPDATVTLKNEEQRRRLLYFRGRTARHLHDCRRKGEF